MDKKYIVIILAALSFCVFLFLYLRGQEDVWLCVDGEWQKHGNPASAPQGLCQKDDVKPISSFNDCVAAGNPVMESYPRQCRDTAGILFIEELPAQEGSADRQATGTPDIVIPAVATTSEVMISTTSEDTLVLEFPTEGQQVESPLLIRGKARGNWFFEGTFPVTLVNWDGLIIADGVAHADADWMSSELVPFSARLEFQVDTTVSNRGALILKNDNPSGLPENDRSHEITIFFRKSQ